MNYMQSFLQEFFIESLYYVSKSQISQSKVNVFSILLLIFPPIVLFIWSCRYISTFLLYIYFLESSICFVCLYNYKRALTRLCKYLLLLCVITFITSMIGLQFKYVSCAYSNWNNKIKSGSRYCTL